MIYDSKNVIIIDLIFGVQDKVGLVGNLISALGKFIFLKKKQQKNKKKNWCRNV